MMTERERRASPKNRWTRWYMWLAYGGGILDVTALVVVIMTMPAAPSRDDESVARHHNTPTLSPQDSAALMRQHPSINSPAELEDLQFMANQDGITLEESIARYAWGDDFTEVVGVIRNDDPDSVVHAAITSGSTAQIEVSGSISSNARNAIDKFKSENPHVEISLKTGRRQGFTAREVEEAVVGAHFAVMEEDEVQDSVTYFDHDANEIVVTVQMATPPSDEKLSSLEKAATRGGADATRPDITDSITISLSVVQHDLSGTDGYHAPN